MIFEDGEKWIKEDMPVEVTYLSSNTYPDVTYLKLTADNLERLINNRITDVRIYTA